MSNDTIKLDKAVITDLVERGIRLHQEIADLRSDLSEEIKAVAKQINVKPALLNKAVRVAFKSSLSQSREEVDTLEEILEAAGRG